MRLYFWLFSFCCALGSHLGLATEAPEQLTPESLRVSLHQTRDVWQGLNRVHVAKDRIQAARAGLIPSINVTSIVAATVNPFFLLSQVEFLLPFLLPSKWYDLAESRHLYDAERQAFLLLKINLYASLLSVASTYAADLELHEWHLQETQDLETLFEQAHNEQPPLDTFTLDGLFLDLHSARMRRTKIETALASERAALRLALNLSSTKLFTVSSRDYEIPPALDVESRSLDEVTDWAFARAPEQLQLQSLIEAGRSRVWSRRFAFLTGYALRDFSNPQTDPFFVTTDFIRGGFSFFPNLRIASRDVERLRVQVESLRGDLARIVEIGQQQAPLLQERVQETFNAREAAQRRYDILRSRYEQKTAEIGALMGARSRLRETQVEWTLARQELNLARITLHRLGLTGDFALIENCVPAPKKSWTHRKERAEGIRSGLYCPEEVLTVPADASKLAKPTQSEEAQPSYVAP